MLRHRKYVREREKPQVARQVFRDFQKVRGPLALWPEYTFD